MNTYGYTRVSGKGQVEGDGHPRQKSTILAFAEGKYPWVGIFSDDAVQGKSDVEDRPQFQAMLEECDPGDVIIVESLDRLARYYVMQEKLISLLVAKNLTLIAANTGENITEAFMGDPMRRALVQIQGIFAELDKNLIVAKLKKARERIRKDGRKENPDDKRCEGRKPYGHRHGEKRILEYMIDLYRAGESLTEIAGALNRSGVKPRTGGEWYPATVGKILRRVNAVPNDNRGIENGRLRVSE